MTDENGKFDPRRAYEWVPMVLVLLAFVCGSIVYILPHLIIALSDNPEIAQHRIGMILTLPINETFNYLLISLVSFWLGKKAGDLKDKV